MDKVTSDFQNLPQLESCTIAILGLGYVGLPLAVEFVKRKKCFKSGKKLSRKIIGLDINENRIDSLLKGIDYTNEINELDRHYINKLNLTTDENDLNTADIFILTVPTPIDKNKKPNLEPLFSAAKTVGKCFRNRLRIKDKKYISPIVIIESTVFPGLTEELIVPIIESESNLNLNDIDPKKGFYCGYSPERINPGDKERRLKDIIKVTSGSTKKVGIWIDNLYASIIDVGTYLAPSIKVAEAAKIIENTQRDLNIALMNELSIIFKRIGLDTLDVLEAASTKWNFLNFKPGLVGGHCIGVDPYYLTYKSEILGYTPEIVLAGRKINDQMSKWISDQIILEMTKRNIIEEKTEILILGLTFKENCADLRNSKVIDLISYLKNFGIITTISDPFCDTEEAKTKYRLIVHKDIPKDRKFKAIVVTLKHKNYLKLDEKYFSKILYENGLIFDLKGFLPKSNNVIRF